MLPLKLKKTSNTAKRMRLFQWIFAIVVIGLNSYFIYAPLYKLTNSYTNFYFSLFDNIRYGHYIAQKFFLPSAGFVFLLSFYLVGKKLKLVTFIKKYRLYILVLLGIVIVARGLGLLHWFYLDDYRFVGDYFSPNPDLQAIPCCGYGYPAMGIMYLVVRWFGRNFVLYKLLGITILYIDSIILFLIIKKLQNNNLIAILSSLFFLSLPTYFHTTLAVQEFTGDSFSLLLFLISILLMLYKIYPETIIFASASLEFGLSRSHIIPIPLVLTYLLFTNKKSLTIIFTKLNKSRSKVMKNLKSSLSYFSIPLLILITSALYIPVLTFRSNFRGTSPFEYFKAASNRLIALSYVPIVMIPHLLLKPIVYLYYKMVGNYWAFPALALSIISLVSIFIFIKYLKRNYFVADITLLGMSIILPAVVLPQVFGVRNIQLLDKFTLDFLHSTTPVRQTAYGLYPAVGLTFIFTAILKLVTVKKAKIFACTIIVLNLITLLIADVSWYKSFGKRQKSINTQLNQIITKRGNDDIVILIADTVGNFTPDIIRYHDIYLKPNKLVVINTPEELQDKIIEDEIDRNQVYFLKFELPYVITDYTDYLHTTNVDNLVKETKAKCEECKAWRRKE